MHAKHKAQTRIMLFCQITKKEIDIVVDYPDKKMVANYVDK